MVKAKKINEVNVKSKKGCVGMTFQTTLNGKQKTKNKVNINQVEFDSDSDSSDFSYDPAYDSGAQSSASESGSANEFSGSETESAGEEKVSTMPAGSRRVQKFMKTVNEKRMRQDPEYHNSVCEELAKIYQANKEERMRQLEEFMDRVVEEEKASMGCASGSESEGEMAQVLDRRLALR